jgi:hypothetical protein
MALARAGLHDDAGPAERKETEMQVRFAATRRIERPWYAWVAAALELATGILAIPVGISFITDPTGAGMSIPQGWIEASPFGSYLLPGLYLLFVNGFAMLAAAALAVVGHWLSPWLTGALGAGLVIWIAVQIIVLPETMFLTWVFLATGFALAAIGLAWLRRTGQLVLRP